MYVKILEDRFSAAKKGKIFADDLSCKMSVVLHSRQIAPELSGGSPPSRNAQVPRFLGTCVIMRRGPGRAPHSRILRIGRLPMLIARGAG
jgi:hypothetical protein